MPVPVLTSALLATLVAGAAPAPVDAAPPCAACVALSLDSTEAGRIAAEGFPLGGLPIVLAATSDAGPMIEALDRQGARVWITIDAAQARHSLPPLDHVSGVWIVTGRASDPARAVFELRTAATAVRGAATVRVGAVLTPALLQPDRVRAIAPYVDAVLLTRDDPASSSRVPGLFSGLDVWMASDTSDLLRGASTTLETRVVEPRGDAVAAARLLAVLGPWMPPGLTPLTDVGVRCAGCTSSAWLQPDTLDAIVELDAPPAGGRVTVTPAAAEIQMVDTGAPAAPANVPLLPGSSGAVEAIVPASSGRVVLRVAGWPGETSLYRTGVEVSARRTLSVEEILARHQAQRARQAMLVQTDIATGTTVLTFQVPALAGPVTITADTTIFTRGGLVEIAQRAIKVNGVDMGVRSGVPRLPLIEPERVSTPPLTITLTAAYRYRLAGQDEMAAGRRCYVLAFEPASADAPAFAGRAWIDMAGFALVRMDASQTGLRGAIVSSQQHDEYAPVRVDGREVWLQARSASYQIYEAAGLRTPIHREIATPTHRVNARDFSMRLDRAHASDAVMLRDTPQGYRYLVPASAPAAPGPGAPARRVLAARAGERVVTLAFGIIDDPNITVPLPYAGLSYLDFNFLGRGVQLSGFFGGTYAQAAWTAPRMFRPGWKLTGRAFGIAAWYNDRSFRDGIERYAENIEQRPFHADVGLIVPVSSRVQVRMGYDFDYVAFRRGPDTAPDFVVPPDAIVHAARVALDMQRGPWSTLLWWNPGRRQHWDRWGPSGSFGRGDDTGDFQRYGAMLSRSWVLSPGSIARVEAAWMDGHDLDRFSRYSVDSFERQLHGYPSASLRFDRGAVVRSVATWTPAPRLRIDAFADAAAVRDPGFGRGLRAYPGVGAALEVPLPRRFLVAAEWGYGFKARNSNGTEGTQVVRVSGLKVF